MASCLSYSDPEMVKSGYGTFASFLYDSHICSVSFKLKTKKKKVENICRFLYSNPQIIHAVSLREVLQVTFTF